MLRVDSFCELGNIGSRQIGIDGNAVVLSKCRADFNETGTKKRFSSGNINPAVFRNAFKAGCDVFRRITTARRVLNLLFIRMRKAVLASKIALPINKPCNHRVNMGVFPLSAEFDHCKPRISESYSFCFIIILTIRINAKYLVSSKTSFVYMISFSLPPASCCG